MNAMSPIEACRMCLAVNMRMYSIVGTPLEDVYEKMTKRTFQSRDGKPMMACYICHHLLTKWLTFTVRALRADKVLQKMLDRGKLTQKTISSIDSAPLKPSLVLSSEYSINLPEIIDVPVETLDIKEEKWDDGDEDMAHGYPNGNIESEETRPKIDEALVKVKSNLMRNTVDKPYKCQHCNKGYSIRANLYKHVKIHSMQGPYPCELCNITFWKKYDLTLHLRRKHNEPPPVDDTEHNGMFICNICEKSFAHRRYLQIHLRKHAKVKPYMCHLCGKFYVHYSLLKKHIIETHKQDPEGMKVYRCKQCHKTYVKSVLLRVHTISHAEEKKYSCNVCGNKL